MNITLEEARTLDAVARLGSFAKAAQILNKSHSAIIYSLKSLETQTGLNILDRSSYRTTLTPVGKRVWEQCKQLLSSEQDFTQLCQELGSGWEPYLKIVFDGLIPFPAVLSALEKLKSQKIPTKIELYEEFLAGVEKSFNEHSADFMISVIPPEKTSLEATRLAQISSYLVAHKSHPVFKTRKRLTKQQLQEHLFLSVRGSNTKLNLPTSVFDEAPAYHLNNFHSEKEAIMKGLGFGWLPEYLVRNELKKQTLKIIRWEKSSTHTYSPFVYNRGPKRLGRAGSAFLNAILEVQNTLPPSNSLSVR